MKRIVLLVAAPAALMLAAGNPASAHPAPGYRCFFGNLHAHTRYSDGESTPDTAYAYARDVAGIHIQALTEHNNGGIGYSITPANYQNLLLVADTITSPGRFVALAGQELGSIGSSGFGHLNVWETPGLWAYNNSDLLGCYSWLMAQRQPAMFNHPDSNWASNFNDLYFYPDYDDAISLLEVVNHNTLYENSYLRALAKGWHVGASANQDNHSRTWGTRTGSAGTALTGVWADTLTKPAVLEALRSRRTFAMLCKPIGEKFQLSLTADGRWMGERYLRQPGRCTLQVTASSPDSIFSKLYLYRDGVIADSTMPNLNVVSWRIELDAGIGSHYYFVKALQRGGGRGWTSPAFVEVAPKRDDDLVVTWPTPVADQGARIAFTPLDGATRVTAEIFNLAGARVWRAVSADPAASIRWDGRDAQGRPMPNGIYLIIVEQAGPAQTKTSKGKTMVSR